MNPIERADKLKKEADDLLRDIRLEEVCRDIGKLYPTGSYYLDLMIYPDIDLYVPPATPRQLFQVVSELAETQPVERVMFLNRGAGPLKDGLYIKPVIAVGGWERPWKIDIWAVDQVFIEEKHAELSSYKERMTSEQRERILEYKFSILTEKHRTPVFSGIYIYRAIIDHGMWEDADITAYLRAHSIEI